MNKKLLVVLLVLTFVLGSVSVFWSKPVSASTGEERRVMLCAAWPWSDEDWNTVTPPPSSDQDSTYSPTNSAGSGDMPKPQKVQQKCEKPFWSRVRFFLFNLRVLFRGK